MPTLSVVIPVYNECGTILQTVERVRSSPIEGHRDHRRRRRLDGRDARRRENQLQSLVARVIMFDQNRGKGAALPYAGRTYAERKKINWKDGVRALWCIFKYNLLR